MVDKTGPGPAEEVAGTCVLGGHIHTDRHTTDCRVL